MSCMLEFCRCPDWSTQPTVTFSPAPYQNIAALSPEVVAIVLPPMDTITSQVLTPAESAGEPEFTPTTSAPELVGTDVQVTCEAMSRTRTPSSPRSPTCTFALLCRFSIWRASCTARLIGIANAVLLPTPENRPFVAAAVFIPITSPLEFTSGPPE